MTPTGRVNLAAVLFILASGFILFQIFFPPTDAVIISGTGEKLTATRGITYIFFGVVFFFALVLRPLWGITGNSLWFRLVLAALPFLFAVGMFEGIVRAKPHVDQSLNSQLTGLYLLSSLFALVASLLTAFSPAPSRKDPLGLKDGLLRNRKDS